MVKRRSLLGLICLLAILYAGTGHAQFAGAGGFPPLSGRASVAPGGAGTVTNVSCGTGLSCTNPTTTPVISRLSATAGQVELMNAGATAWVPVTISGDSTITSTGVMTNQKVNGNPVSATAPTAAQIWVENAGATSMAPVTITGAGDCATLSLSSAGALTSTCLSSNGNLFTSAAFGTALNLSAPPAIGGTTPAAGTFTTLASSAGGTTSAAFGTALNLTAPPAIGGTTSAAGTFTTINAINPLGTISGAGTASPVLTGVGYVTMTVGGGNITLAKPSGGATNIVYHMFIFSTANITITPAAGWQIPDQSLGTLVALGAFVSGANGGVVQFDFMFDGTNYDLISSPYISARTITGNTATIGSQLKVIAGGLFSETGGTAPTATCSGGSTGVVVGAGNASCTASVTPFPCCTGSGTGTCVGSTNQHGIIQTSSSASTNCTITWSASATWPQAPFCDFSDGSASITPTLVSTGNCGTSTCVFDFASAASKDFIWQCS